MSDRSKKIVGPKDNTPTAPDLLADIRRMIEDARVTVARTFNTGLTMLYWRFGYRTHQEILKGKRADYGEDIVSTLSRQLKMEKRG